MSTVTHTSLDHDEFESHRGFYRAIQDFVRGFLIAAFNPRRPS
ncbi:hypothetical protein [Rhodopseudomonas sp.]|nr:hypothetical protein [Rhodopseudomonas sp.]